MNYHWNWSIFFEPAPNGTGTYLDMLLSGLVLTIETAICAWVIALIFGAVIGVMRTLPSRTASSIGFAYVEFFRNMPLLVQLFLWFFVLPEILPNSWGLWLKQIPNSPFYTATIGIGLKATPTASGSAPPIAAPMPTPGLARQAHSRRDESSAQMIAG